MQNREVIFKIDQSLESILDDLIIHVKRSKILSEKNYQIIDDTFQKFFKRVELDLEEVFPGIVVVSTVLGLLICRILRHWKKEIPTLTSDVETIEILDKAMEFDLAIDPSLWEGIKSATRILQDTINKETQKRLRDLIANCDLQELLLKDSLGSRLQEVLPHSLRKALAANYTSLISSELLAKLAIEQGNITIIDPFCGSGRLLTAVLDQMSSQQSVAVQVIGNELLGIAATLALARILYWFKSHHRAPNLFLTSGDAFERTSPVLPLRKNECQYFGEYDLVIMNPPFTRYLRLQPSYLNRLFQLYEPYAAYMEKRVCPLHVFALFLADRILKPGGRLAAVLPAPTFYSQYADGLKRFLVNNYQLKFVIGSTTGKAFSEGSDLKEILFIADKLKPTPTMKTTFATIETPLTKSNIHEIAEGLRSNRILGLPLKVQKVGQQELESNWNWIRFLEIGALQALAISLRQTGRIKSAHDLNLRIVRGFEMYGPEFFFIPNQNWEVVERTKDSIIVKHKETNRSFEFPTNWLIKSLRKPGLYSSWITPKIDHFALRISKKLDPAILEPYISANPKTWKVANQRFGPDWITHIHTQLESKNPYGHLFIVDKFGITTTGVIAHFTDECLTASKNFYVIDCPVDKAKLLAAWLNSTIFILLFLASRREIGGAYGRLQIIDYQNEPLFIDTTSIDPTVSEKIEYLFNTFRNQPLPPLKEQLTLKSRKTLDILFLEALGFHKVEAIKLRKTICLEVKRLFMEIDTRSKHKRRRT
ncbi:MAG: N-6 DNA methylase [Candidatus Heimdallarchaeota archaeon]